MHYLYQRRGSRNYDWRHGAPRGYRAAQAKQLGSLGSLAPEVFRPGAPEVLTGIDDLYAAGLYATGKVSGVASTSYNPNELKAYQLAHGITADGKFGVETMAQLERDMAARRTSRRNLALAGAAALGLYLIFGRR